MLNMSSLRAELREAGLFERREAETWWKAGFFLLVFFSLIAIQAHSPLWLCALLMPVTALFGTGFAMIGHEGCHRGLSSNPKRNALMAHLCFPLFGGLGVLYWSNKHNIQHHTHPNVEDEDPDVDLWPMACTRDHHLRSGPFRQWFQKRIQGYIFWPLTTMMIWTMRYSSIQYLYRYAKTKGIDARWNKDVAALAGHYTGWLIIPSAVFGWSGFAYYIALWLCISLCLAAVFAPAHIGLPIMKDHGDTWRLQFETTRNLKLPKWLSLFFIGLEYQVEHHLFPKISHFNLPKAAEITKRWAMERGVPYFEVEYWAGLKDATHFIHHGWNYEPVADPGPLTLTPVDGDDAELAQIHAAHA